MACLDQNHVWVNDEQLSIGSLVDHLNGQHLTYPVPETWTGRGLANLHWECHSKGYRVATELPEGWD